MNNLMLVLKTCGTTPDAPILVLAAQLFCPEKRTLGAKFEMAVSLASEMRKGARPDPDVLEQRMQHSSEKSAAVLNLPCDIGYMISELDCFISRYVVGSPLRVWSKNVSENNVILRAAYARVGRKPFWQSDNDRDINLLIDLCRTTGRAGGLSFAVSGSTAGEIAASQVHIVNSALNDLFAKEGGQ